MVKIYESSTEVIKDVVSGSTIMIGGFGICGIAENLLRALYNSGSDKLNLITLTAHIDGYGVGKLIDAKRVKSMIASYIGENKEVERQYFNGEIEIDLIPQGTFAERMRAQGVGIPAFYSPVGVGTEVAEGKEVRVINGKEYILEEALGADFAFVKAWKADTKGNLVYRKTAKNFNPVMATAGKITIAEVEEIVPAGELDPNEIDTPGIYVQRLVKGEFFEKKIERLTLKK
ncbi:CoA transferase subunit A [bacterium]|nr:CoA transferase subunit A [bacterium]